MASFKIANLIKSDFVLIRISMESMRADVKLTRVNQSLCLVNTRAWWLWQLTLTPITMHFHHELFSFELSRLAFRNRRLNFLRFVLVLC